uniref:Uncharacterized protein n=1 Tax=Panagrolaimus sp. ES5 TaxID=591445 RepID=A0AC34FFL8_9BILA
MSGNIRKNLGLALNRQQTKIVAAQAFLALNGTYTIVRRNQGVVLIKKLRVSYEEYEKIDENFQDLIEGITDATEKAKEEQIYQELAYDDQNKIPFKTIMSDLLEAIGDIEAEIEIEIIEKMTAAPAFTAPAAAIPGTPGTAPATITVPSQIVLLNNPGPERKQRLYSGNPGGYKGFIEDWNNSVGNKPDIADVLKLQMLKQRVDGEAYAAISRFSTAAEYPEALDKLKQRFGQTEDAVDILLENLNVSVRDKHDLVAVRKAFDDFEVNLTALGGYGEDIEAKALKSLLKSKLPEEIILHLSVYEGALPAGVATLTEYRKQADRLIAHFKKTYGRYMPRVFKPNNKPVFSAKPVTFIPNNGQKVQRQQIVQQEYKKVTTFSPKCSFCEGLHFSDDCPSCTTLQEAQQIAADKHLCLKCFKVGHSAEKCMMRVKCRKCQQRHHTLHCKVNLSKKSPPVKKPGERVIVAANKVVAQKDDTEVLLLSREVTVSHPDYPEKSQKVLVFVDNGAQISLIDRDLTKSLHLPVQEFSTDCQGPTGEIFVAKGRFKLNLHLQDGTKYLVQACRSTDIIHKLTVPTAPVEQFWDSTREMKQPLQVKQGSPKLLLSMKEFSELVAHQPSKELKNGSVLRKHSRTKSPIVTAIVAKNETPVDSTKTTAIVLADAAKKDGEPGELGKDDVFQHQEVNISDAAVQDYTFEQGSKQVVPVVAKISATELISDPKFLYDLELMGIKDDPNADENRLFQQRFLETVEQVEDGRIFAELPFHDHSNLGTNFNNSYRRLASQSKKFLKDPPYAALYKSGVDELSDSKFAEVVSNDVLNDSDSHIMPHTTVITPGKTTSARIVFDGSCKTEKGESINDKLLTGENRLPQLAGILLRARFHLIIVASDIKKAFLQVHLKQASRKYVRFLFVKDPSKPLTRDNLIVYQFCVVPFGLNASSNMLAHAIEYLLRKFAHLNPTFARYLLQVLRNNYVDNLVMGSKLVKEAITANEVVKKAFAAGQMDLRGHVSNNLEVNEHFKVDVKSFNLLGHELIIDSDELVFGWKKLDPTKSPKTKRALLSFAASLFDLLGILGPLRVPIKLLIRRAWDHKVDWKSLMDSSLIADVKLIYDERVNFSMKIKRHIFLNADPSQVQLHIFADASALAYGCVVYVRYLDNDNKFQTTLIFAQSRIAPIKPVMTITKLELTATALALHVAGFLRSEIQDVILIEKVIIYTDSTTVLYWIKNPEGKGRFVINRVNKLNASDAKFRHVQGPLNPADLVSRGCSPYELVNNRLWFEGPEFLRKAEEFWPAQPNLDQEAEKLEPLIVAALKVSDSKKVIIAQKIALVDAKPYCSWQSLVRTYAILLKFLSLK